MWYQVQNHKCIYSSGEQSLQACKLHHQYLSPIFAKEVLKEKALPMALWPLTVTHTVWIKNHVFTHSLEPSNSPHHVYFGKKPNLCSVCLFGCKAYLHVPKIDQSKLGEHSIECGYVGCGLEKSAYMLYNREQRCLFESQDVKFEEPTDRSQIDVDSDSDIDNSDGSSDPEGGSKALDHKEEPKTSSDIEKSIHTSPQDPPAPPHSQSQSPPTTQPSIRKSTHANQDIPYICADEDPKLELGSRNPVEKSQGLASVGEKDGKDGTLYLTVDAPQSYHEAMSHPDADKWVAAVSVEYQALVQRGVFEEVE